MVKLVCTSDWHGHLPTDLPDGDILVVAGDLTPVWDHNREFQIGWTRHDLIPFLRGLPYKHIVCIAGNHDFAYQYDRKKIDVLFDIPSSNVHYLKDASVELMGLKFFGSPWSNQFGSWAFMGDEYQLQNKYNLIPHDTDVLIAHGPPYGCLDQTLYYQSNAGSRRLREKIISVKPILVVTGHIHEGYGQDMIGKTTVVNASRMNVDYEPVNPAFVIDLHT